MREMYGKNLLRDVLSDVLERCITEMYVWDVLERCIGEMY